MILPDAEKLAVAWVRANPALRVLLGYQVGPPVVNARVATSLPEKPTWPFLRVIRIPGGTRDPDVPWDWSRLQFDAYAGRRAAGADVASASLVARTLVEQLDALDGAETIVGEGVILGCQISQGPVPVPEPETEWARFLVEAVLVVASLP